MKLSPRALVLSTVSIVGLAIGYGVIFSVYASGLFGGTTRIPPEVWERTLRQTIFLGPFLGAFVLLAFLAWRQGWSSGPLPWAAGAAGVILLARRDAGILSPFDFLWIAITLFVVSRARRGAEDDDGPES